MRRIEKVAVIGLGALGSAYASKIADTDPTGLVVIAGEERIKRYQAEGIIINGRAYDFTYASPDKTGQTVDLIIVAVKTYQLPQAIADIRNQVGKNTIILSLLNGITSEVLLSEAFGKEKVLYALSFALTPNREGNQIRFSGYGNLAFGEESNTQYSEKVLAVKEFFDRTGIPYSIPENMLRELWWKFMVNVGINQCSAVTRGRYGLFQSNPKAKELMEMAMREVLLLSEREGVNLNESDMQKWSKVLHALDPESRTSMLEDIESGRRTEVEAFSGTVCALGEKYGIATPVNRMLFNMIKIIEETNG